MEAELFFRGARPAISVSLSVRRPRHPSPSAPTPGHQAVFTLNRLAKPLHGHPIYNDLSEQAVAYHQMSLLLEVSSILESRIAGTSFGGNVREMGRVLSAYTSDVAYSMTCSRWSQVSLTVLRASEVSKTRWCNYLLVFAACVSTWGQTILVSPSSVMTVTSSPSSP